MVAKEVGMDDLANRLHDLFYFHELADVFEPPDDRL